MVQFLQSMDLTGFSDLRGSVSAWTPNAHAWCFDKEHFLCVSFWQTTVSVEYTQSSYLYLFEDGSKAVSFDQLIIYFAEIKKCN